MDGWADRQALQSAPSQTCMLQEGSDHQNTWLEVFLDLLLLLFSGEKMLLVCLMDFSLSGGCLQKMQMWDVCAKCGFPLPSPDVAPL